MMDHLIRWIPKKMLSKLIFCTWTPLIRREAVVITMGTIAADSTTIDRKISMTRKNKKKRSHQQSAYWKADHEIHGEDWNHPHGNTHSGLLLRGTGSPCPPKMNPEGEMTMKPDYRNWMPRGMIIGLGTAAGVLAAGSAAAVWSRLPLDRTSRHLAGAAWSLYAREMFSYEGGRQLSRQIVEGVAASITLPEGGVGLDVGCGSGALTIACAKRNPQGRMVGVDRWGVEYASYSRKLCERNAQAEGVDNITFQKGDARHLDFPDETFDAVTSNYVYHNITGADKQALLRETLRVLKKGGIFAIHDLMEPSRYGDMDEFLRKLREEGFQEARLLPTADGTFMTPREGKTLFLSGSALLVGRK